LRTDRIQAVPRRQHPNGRCRLTAITEAKSRGATPKRQGTGGAASRANLRPGKHRYRHIEIEKGMAGELPSLSISFLKLAETVPRRGAPSRNGPATLQQLVLSIRRTAQPPYSGAGSSAAGLSAAGSSAAGISAAGSSAAGSSAAGSAAAGSSAAGSSAAGSSAAGSSAAGSSAAGSSAAGTSAAGSSIDGLGSIGGLSSAAHPMNRPIESNNSNTPHLFIVVPHILAKDLR